MEEKVGLESGMAAEPLQGAFGPEDPLQPARVTLQGRWAAWVWPAYCSKASALSFSNQVTRVSVGCSAALTGKFGLSRELLLSSPLEHVVLCALILFLGWGFDRGAFDCGCDS